MSARLALYLHFNPKGRLSRYVLFALGELAQVCKEIYFITNSPLKPLDRSALKGLVTHIHERANTGFDFGGYAETLLQIAGKEKVQSFDELVLINDSCYGPFRPMHEIWKEMETRHCDFWGITSFIKTSSKKIPQQVIKKYMKEADYLQMIKQGIFFTPLHLQSYFIVMKKNVLLSPVFWSFWENLPPLRNFKNAIDAGEISLSHTLQIAGFTLSSLCKPFEESYFYSTKTVLEENPFIKRKAFTHQKNFPLLSFLIKEGHGLKKIHYDFSLIIEDLEQTFSLASLVCEFHQSGIFLPFLKNTENKKPSSLLDHLALHLHLRTVEDFLLFLQVQGSNHTNFDLYLSYPKSLHEDEFQQALELHPLRSLRKLYFCPFDPNQASRPLRTFYESLKEHYTHYELLGHFHFEFLSPLSIIDPEKDILCIEGFSLEYEHRLWQLFESFLLERDQRVQDLMNDPHLGLYTTQYRETLSPFPRSSSSKASLFSLAEKLGILEEIKSREDWKNSAIFFPAEGIFFARSALLKNFFEISLDATNNFAPTLSGLASRTTQSPLWLAEMPIDPLSLLLPYLISSQGFLVRGNIPSNLKLIDLGIPLSLRTRLITLLDKLPLALWLKLRSIFYTLKNFLANRSHSR